MNTLKIKRFKDDVQLPTRAYENDAGLDLYAPTDIEIKYGTCVKIPSGIGVSIPNGYVGLLFDRSSLGALGLRVLGGVIDSGFRGEIHIVLANVAQEETVKLPKNSKIMQLLIVPIITPKIEEVFEFEDTERGENGFGSSGK